MLYLGILLKVHSKRDFPPIGEIPYTVHFTNINIHSFVMVVELSTDLEILTTLLVMEIMVTCSKYVDTVQCFAGWLSTLKFRWWYLRWHWRSHIAPCVPHHSRGEMLHPASLQGKILAYLHCSRGNPSAPPVSIHTHLVSKPTATHSKGYPHLLFKSVRGSCSD